MTQVGSMITHICFQNGTELRVYFNDDNSINIINVTGHISKMEVDSSDIDCTKIKIIQKVLNPNL